MYVFRDKIFIGRAISKKKRLVGVHSSYRRDSNVLFPRSRGPGARNCRKKMKTNAHENKSLRENCSSNASVCSQNTSTVATGITEYIRSKEP